MFYHLLRNRVLLLQSSHLQIVLLPSLPSKSKWISRGERHENFTQPSRSFLTHGFPRTRWFKVTFLSPSWRSLNLWKGHFNIPKRSLAELPRRDLCFARNMISWINVSSSVECGISVFLFPVLPLDFGGRKNNENDQHKTTTRWAQKPVIDWIRT